MNRSSITILVAAIIFITACQNKNTTPAPVNTFTTKPNPIRDSMKCSNPVSRYPYTDTFMGKEIISVEGYCCTSAPGIVDVIQTQYCITHTDSLSIKFTAFVPDSAQYCPNGKYIEGVFFSSVTFNSTPFLNITTSCGSSMPGSISFSISADSLIFGYQKNYGCPCLTISTFYGKKKG